MSLSRLPTKSWERQCRTICQLKTGNYIHTCFSQGLPTAVVPPDPAAPRDQAHASHPERELLLARSRRGRRIDSKKTRHLSAIQTYSCKKVWENSIASKQQTHPFGRCI